MIDTEHNLVYTREDSAFPKDAQANLPEWFSHPFNAERCQAGKL